MQALETFRRAPYFHNCAQAIANRWHHLYAQGAEIVGMYAPYKGGLAPGGLCGALYAAMQAMPERSDEIHAAFLARVGADHCRDIKAIGSTPCQVCVATADRILEKLNAES